MLKLKVYTIKSQVIYLAQIYQQKNKEKVINKHFKNLICKIKSINKLMKN